MQMTGPQHPVFAELRRQKRAEKAVELRRRIATLKARTGAGDDHPLVKRLVDELNALTRES